MNTLRCRVRGCRITYTINVFCACAFDLDAGYGTFSRTFISSGTWLGEYEGEVFIDDTYLTPYAWTIPRADVYVYNIDAARIATSNWLRWVNCPRTKREENVKGVYCYGRILYIVIKAIYPGQELLVYYGHSYAKILGIDTSEFERHDNVHEYDDEDEDDEDDEDDNDEEEDEDKEEGEQDDACACYQPKNCGAPAD